MKQYHRFLHSLVEVVPCKHTLRIFGHHMHVSNSFKLGGKVISNQWWFVYDSPSPDPSFTCLYIRYMPFPTSYSNYTWSIKNLGYIQITYYFADETHLTFQNPQTSSRSSSPLSTISNMYTVHGCSLFFYIIILCII